MILLAFDIGTHLGYAIGPKDGKPRLGTLELRDVRDLGAWLKSGDEGIRALLEEADEVVCERPFASQDAGAAKNFALLGHILWWATLKGVTKHPSYSPMTVKAHFAGHGHADKEDMMTAARARGFMPTCYDEADACGVWHAQVAGVTPVPKKKPKARKAKAAPKAKA